jgi:hypothetical protein
MMATPAPLGHSIAEAVYGDTAPLQKLLARNMQRPMDIQFPCAHPVPFGCSIIAPKVEKKVKKL